jgi:disulfide bond formation protein DsbB
MSDLLRKSFRAGVFPERAVDYWVNVRRAMKTPFLVACACFSIPILLAISIYAIELYTQSNLPYRIFAVGMTKAIMMLIPDVSMPPEAKQVMDVMPRYQQQLGLVLAFFLLGCFFALVVCLIWAAWKGLRVAFSPRK